MREMILGCLNIKRIDVVSEVIIRRPHSPGISPEARYVLSEGKSIIK